MQITELVDPKESFPHVLHLNFHEQNLEDCHTKHMLAIIYYVILQKQYSHVVYL